MRLIGDILLLFVVVAWGIIEAVAYIAFILAAIVGFGALVMLLLSAL